MAVLPKENIHKMKLKLLLNRLLIFGGHLFSLRAVHSVTGGFCLFIFFRLWHNRMPYASLSRDICYSNFMSG